HGLLVEMLGQLRKALVSKVRRDRHILEKCAELVSDLLVDRRDHLVADQHLAPLALGARSDELEHERGASLAQAPYRGSALGSSGLDQDWKEGDPVCSGVCYRARRGSSRSTNKEPA